jgi:peptidyl-tRNA hydrolase, PTH1 family
MWVIAGLGNPGRKYSRTRHNVGFMVIEEFAKRFDIDFRDRDAYRIGRGSIEGCAVLLLEPLLYMNRSGTVVREVLKKFSVPPGNLMVVHDDLDMEKGKLRIRKTGSSGGHKGVQSIMQDIGTPDFVRLKIGIGREEGMPAEEFVLRKFGRQEINVIKDTIQEAAEAIRSVILEGVDKAMNRFN